MGTSKIDQMVNLLLGKDLDNLDDESVKEIMCLLSGMEKIDSDEQLAEAFFYAGVNLLEEEDADNNSIISPSERAVMAFKFLKFAAEYGLPEAMGNVGHCYWNGIGVRQNKTQAVRWFRKAANAGDVESMRSIGYAYNVGEGVNRNSKKAFDWYEKAASNGDGRAMLEVGVKYKDGDGVEKNTAKAMEWFTNCIASEHSCKWMAMLYLAEMLESDPLEEGNLDEVKEMYESAYDLCFEATEKGDTEAMLHMGNFFYEGNELLEIDENPSKAVEYYEKAANEGFAQAMNMLGVCYSNGKGVGEDNLKACWWFEQATAKGFTAAKVNLACHYLLGDGIKADYEKATELLQQVSDSQFCFAQTILGICYLNGVGVAKDLRKGIEWLRKGAKNGDGSAYCNLAFCYLDGRGLRKNEQEAFKYFEKGASLGDVYSSVSMAECYMNGTGTKQDYKTAAELLESICEEEQQEREFPNTAVITDYSGWKSIGDPLHLVNEHVYAKAYYLLAKIYASGGDGVVGKDNAKATRLLNIAENLGYKDTVNLDLTISDLRKDIAAESESESLPSQGRLKVQKHMCHNKQFGLYNFIYQKPDGSELTLKFSTARAKFLYLMTVLSVKTGCQLRPIMFDELKDEMVQLISDLSVNTKNVNRDNWISKFYSDVDYKAGAYSTAGSNVNSYFKDNMSTQDYEVCKLEQPGRGRNSVKTIGLPAENIEVDPFFNNFMDAIIRVKKGNAIE